jgi:isopentenyl-diphosphate delta-isomerase type 1
MDISDEQFDVVNERDEVVGVQPRAEVHRRGLRHRAVHVLVWNAAGQLFLQRRSLAKDCSPGLWDSSASGHLGVGEGYDEAVVRELEEELGVVAAELPRALFKLEASAETGQEFVWVYRCEGEGPFRLHPEEIMDGGWFTTEDVTRWVTRAPEEFASSFVLIWLELKRRGLA